MDHAQFQETVWQYGAQLFRPMPWRDNPEPYFVLVSELMLQQTQVDRVVPKFDAFITRFPDVATLARASLAEVLTLWSGLGYNRRAKFLWQAAQQIEQEFAGHMPQTRGELERLPGVGSNTAGAILAYAYDQPVVFIETNIRTVLLHHFFADSSEQVSDRELYQLAEEVLDTEQPRQWYWALMDYGAHLKKTVGGRLDQSKQYKKQSPLQGSQREMRGRIVRALTKKSPLEIQALEEIVAADARFQQALDDLIAEEMVTHKDGIVALKGV